MSTTNPKKSNAPRTPQQWYLVTNHLNLLYMLAAGLVMEPSGFRGKYYIDSLSAIPGWIPLFRNVLPAKALEQATSERSHLRPCVVSLDLSNVFGSVQVLSREGKIRNAKFPNIRLGRNGVGILVRASLPLTLLSQIYFRSNEDQKIFEIAAKDVSNVDLELCRNRGDKEDLFSNTIDAAWPPQKGKPQSRNTCQKESNGQQGDMLEGVTNTEQALECTFDSHISAQALGGLLAMLYHGANRSELGVDIFQRITGSACNMDRASIQDPILAELPNWLKGEGVSEGLNIPTRLYWGAVNAVAAPQEISSPSQPVDRVLGYLDAQLTQPIDEQYKPRLERLVADMRSCFSLGGGTITELFEHNKGSLSRPLLLFCLREHCVDLLEFSHPLLSDAQYLLAGILFGVRDGWLGLPCMMRNQALSAYVMYRMANVAHQKQKDDLTLPEILVSQPLRALFPIGADAWSESQTNAAIEISKHNKWQDCIETIIASTDGGSLAEPKQENGKFIFPGEAISTIRVRHEVFLRRLGEWPPIDGKLETEIRDSLPANKDEMGQA